MITESFENFLFENNITEEIDYKLWKDIEVPQNIYLKDKVGIPINNDNSNPRYNILPNLKEDFLKKVVWIANNLSISTDWVMAVMYLESKFNPNASNKVSSAKGLIQWIDSTSKSNFGISSSDIPTNPLRQLDFVYRYFKNMMKIKPNTFLDFYLMVFYPKAVNKPGNFKFSEKAIENNKGLFGFYNDNRYGTKADMESKVFKSNKITVFANLIKKEGGVEYYATTNFIPDVLPDVANQTNSLNGYIRAIKDGGLENA